MGRLTPAQKASVHFSSNSSAARAQVIKGSEELSERSVVSVGGDGHSVLSCISSAALNTPSGRAKGEHISRRKLGGTCHSDFDNLTEDSAPSAAQVDQAKALSDAGLSPHAHTNSTVSPTGSSSERNSSKFAAAKLGSSSSNKEKMKQGGDNCIKKDKSEKRIECALTGHEKLTSDAIGLSGGGGPASSYGSQASQWFTPMNTKRELESCTSDSRNFSPNNDQMVEILSTKKILFDLHKESEGCKQKLDEHASRESDLSNHNHPVEIPELLPIKDGSMPSEIELKTTIKSSPAMDMHPKGRVVSAKFLDRKCRSPASIGTRSAGAKTKPLAAKVMSSPSFKKQLQVRNGATSAMEDRTKFAAGSQRVTKTSKLKIGAHARMSEKKPLRQGSMNSGKDQNSIQSPWNANRFDWIGTLRSDKAGAQASRGKVSHHQLMQKQKRQTGSSSTEVKQVKSDINTKNLKPKKDLMQQTFGSDEEKISTLPETKLNLSEDQSIEQEVAEINLEMVSALQNQTKYKHIGGESFSISGSIDEIQHIGGESSLISGSIDEHGARTCLDPPCTPEKSIAERKFLPKINAARDDVQGPHDSGSVTRILDRSNPPPPYINSEIL